MDPAVPVTRQLDFAGDIPVVFAHATWSEVRRCMAWDPSVVTPLPDGTLYVRGTAANAVRASLLVKLGNR